MLDKKSSMPLYVQMKKRIVGAISSGELQPGDRLPSENELAKRYGINRNTARVALNELAGENILKSVPGSCWVVHPGLKRNLGGISGRTVFFGSSRPNSTDGNELLLSLQSQCELRQVAMDVVSFDEEIDFDKYDNVIWFGPHPEDRDMLLRLLEEGKCVVVANRQFFGMEVPFVAIDQYYGSKDLVSYLTVAGHRKIGCVTLAGDFNYIRERNRGYGDALLDAGLSVNPDWVCRVPSKAQTKMVVKKFLQNNPDLTGLFVAGEIFHRGCAQALEELNLRVPEDISVVLFDESNGFSCCEKPLVLKQPGFLMGVELFELLHHLQNDPELANSKILLNKIIDGDSVKRLN